MSKVDYEALSKGLSRDMSGAAIARRLEIASELYELVRYLAKSRCLGKVERSPASEASASPGGSSPDAAGELEPRE